MEVDGGPGQGWEEVGRVDGDRADVAMGSEGGRIEGWRPGWGVRGWGEGGWGPDLGEGGVEEGRGRER